MVWGVCRRALRHTQDAEDAFQATFLVLARKAATVRWRESIHNWLYEVASRLAAEMRVKAARRRLHEGQAAQTRSEVVPDHAGRELASLLDEELQRLPAHGIERRCYCATWRGRQATRRRVIWGGRCAPCSAG